MSDSLQPHGLHPIRLLCSWDFPGKNTEVGCHFLLRGIFWPMDQTHVSCGSWIAGGFSTAEPQGKPESYTYTAVYYYYHHYLTLHFVAVVVQSLSHVWIFVTSWPAAHQAPLSSTISWHLLKFTCIELVMLTISFSVSSFLFCLQSFPESL